MSNGQETLGGFFFLYAYIRVYCSLSVEKYMYVRERDGKTQEKHVKLSFGDDMQSI